jgi:hypothetical protein
MSVKNEIVAQFEVSLSIGQIPYCGKKAGIKVGAVSQPIKPAQ